MADKVNPVEPSDLGCPCQRCGTRFKVDVNVSDDLWDKIRGEKNLLCGPCIIEAIEPMGELAFDLVPR